jgi:hypothetical protein
LILALGTLLLPGCTTVKRESRMAQALAATTGDHIETGLNTAAVKTRNWWQRMFGPHEPRPAKPAPTPNPRYQTVEPQYVGVAPGS